MTDFIRKAVGERIEARRMTRTEAAAAAGMSAQYLGDLLGGRKGEIPKSWARLLDALNLEVVVRPKRKPKGEPTG
jgi:DNA transposition AAA+ family ATPase